MVNPSQSVDFKKYPAPPHLAPLISSKKLLLWTAKKVADWIEQETGRRLHETSAWQVLRSLGFTLQSVRPTHLKAASLEERAAFKKKSQPNSGRTSSRASG